MKLDRMFFKVQFVTYNSQGFLNDDASGFHDKQQLCLH